MKTMQINTLTALVLFALSAGAVAGEVHSGSPDVNKVFGRSSAIHVSGATIKTAGLSVDAFGRSSNQIGKVGATTLASRSTEGLIAQYGRGTPSHAMAPKASGNVAAKSR